MLYKFIYYVLGPLYKWFFKIKFVNKPDTFPQHRLIICANHISLLDPITLALALDRQVYFLAKKELWDNKLLGWLISKLGAIPVDREGIDLKAIKSSVKILNEEEYLGIFPEGTRVKEVKKENIKNGIAYIALKADSGILPLEIRGEYGFRKGMEVVYKDYIAITPYKDIAKKEAYNEIAQRVYAAIYDFVD